jgi:hypothetical protein
MKSVKRNFGAKAATILSPSL